MWCVQFIQFEALSVDFLFDFVRVVVAVIIFLGIKIKIGTLSCSLYHRPQRPGRPPLAPPLGAPRGAAPLPAVCWPPLLHILIKRCLHFLKRMERYSYIFLVSCERILRYLLSWVKGCTSISTYLLIQVKGQREGSVPA